MTRKEALAELIAKVEAGTWRHADWPTVEKGFWGSWNEAALHFHSAYSGSLDAANALHEAVLPGFWWLRSGFVMTVTNDNTGWGNGIYGRARDDTNPARAWLLAILRALHAQEADT